MKKIIISICIVALMAIAYSCNKSINPPSGTVYLDLPSKAYTYFNKESLSFDNTLNEKATLGRVLFYDGHLSVNNTIACATCHKQNNGFADNVAFSTGFEGRLTKRNSKSILNLIGFDSFFEKNSIYSVGQSLFWDGRENILANLVDRPITNHVEMGIDDANTIPSKLVSLPFYNSLFKNAYYGDSTITSARISECIAIFMASIQSKSSKYDQYLQGNIMVLNASETNGMNLFNGKYNCGSCHHLQTNFYTMSDFKDIGLDESYTDLGLGNITQSTVDNGKFRVPSLHNVALTAPYMHDGRFKTLDEVLEHYSHNILNSPNLDTALKSGSQPISMNISTEDKAALIAFLNTLTDFTTIVDPKFSNPFKVK